MNIWYLIVLNYAMKYFFYIKIENYSTIYIVYIIIVFYNGLKMSLFETTQF